LEDLNTDGRTILKWTLKKQKLRAWDGMNWLRIGCCEGVDELSGVIECGEFVD
jgi:hypothetical protein